MQYLRICRAALAALVLVSAECRAATELQLFTVHHVKQRDIGDVSGVLHRELARQALLIAARDELGMLTCDRTLREEPRTDAPLRLLLTTKANLGVNFDMRLFKVDDFKAGDQPPPPGEAIWSKRVAYEPGSKTTYPSLVGPLHELAMTDFVRVLKEQGAESTDPSDDGDEQRLSRETIDQLLMQTDVISQFAAVRALHGRLAEGESAADLQALARGYANLALLTETSWGASQQALHARALMYCQRMRERYADDPLTKWTYAYVQGVTGIHFLALEAVEEIENRPVGVDETEYVAPPAWTKLIRPYCEYDTTQLGELTEYGADTSQWAAYLRAWAVYNSGEDRRMTDVGREAIAACPEATNLCFMMAYRQPIGIMRTVSSAELSSLIYLLPARLQAVPGIPGGVAAAAGAADQTRPPGEYWRRIIDSLRAAESAGEPSWDALASLLDDQAARAASNFYHVNTAATQEQDFAPIAELMAPFVEGHPDADYFRIAALHGGDLRAAMDDATGKLIIADPNLWMRPALARVYANTADGKDNFGKTAYITASREFTTQSITAAILEVKSGTDAFEMFLRELGKVSPRSPMVLIKKIQAAGESPEPIPPATFAGWEEEAGSSAHAWREIADAYLAINRADDAFRCYEESIAQSPELTTYFTLASAYAQFDQPEMYVPTLERYLEVETFGLEHAQVHNRIAQHHIDQDDFAAAKPSAVAAAESYAAWGLALAARVCEVLGEHDEADRWNQALSQGYTTTSGLDWYLHRRRVGSGDLDEPRELALAWLGPEEHQAQKKSWWVSAYYLLEHDADRAAAAIKAQAEIDDDWFAQSMLLTSALMTGDDNEAEFARQRISKLARPGGQRGEDWIVDYAGLVNKILTATPADGAQLAPAIDAYLKQFEANPPFLCNASYFLGKLLKIKGIPDEGGRCYQRAAQTNQTSLISFTLARAELHDLGLDTPEFDDPSI